MDGRDRGLHEGRAYIRFARSACRLFRKIADTKELADKTVVYLAVGGQVPLVGQMVGTKLAGVKGRFFRLVMVERQHQRHGQHYR